MQKENLVLTAKLNSIVSIFYVRIADKWAVFSQVALDSLIMVLKPVKTHTYTIFIHAARMAQKGTKKNKQKKK